MSINNYLRQHMKLMEKILTVFHCNSCFKSSVMVGVVRQEAQRQLRSRSDVTQQLESITPVSADTTRLQTRLQQLQHIVTATVYKTVSVTELNSSTLQQRSSSDVTGQLQSGTTDTGCLITVRPPPSYSIPYILNDSDFPNALLTQNNYC